MGANFALEYCPGSQHGTHCVEKIESDAVNTDLFHGDHSLKNLSTVVRSLTHLENFGFDKDDVKSDGTESTRSCTTVADTIEAKATMASRVLRSLGDSDYQRAWEKLRDEFENQQVLWGIVESEDCTVACRGQTSRAPNPTIRDGIIAALKSKAEFALAMESAGDAQAIYALEAMLSLNDAMMKQLSAECPEAASPAMSPSMRASVEEVLEMGLVKRARNDLADYCDEVASMTQARFSRCASWTTTTVKACDLRHGVLKEYLNEIFAHDGQQRLILQARLRIPSSMDDQIRY